MTEFLNIFEEIDQDRSGEITAEELEEYMNLKGYDSKFKIKWLNLFDSDGDNIISIDEFCETLGLTPRQDYLDQVNANRAFSAPSLGYDDWDILNVSENFPDSILDAIHDKSVEVIQHKEKESDMAREIKQQLDRDFNPTWHVVISRSQIGAKFSHVKGYFIQYKMHDRMFLAFKTPINSH